MQNIRDLAKKYDYIFVYESTLDTMPTANPSARGVVVSRRGYQQYKLSIQTQGGHSGAIIEKAKRVSANLIMAEFMLELEKLADYENRLTFNSGLIEGGKAVNIISPNCTIIFDCRFASMADFEIANENVKKLVQKFQAIYPLANFELDIQDFFPSMDEMSNSLQFIDKLSNRINFEIIKERRNGGSEASVFASANPQAIVIDGLGVRGGDEHTKSEFAYIQSFADAVRFSLELIENINKQ
jgi:glutamate carboxypeptidase